MIGRPGGKGGDAKERALWGDLLSLGMVFPIAILLGWFIGKWVGGKLGHPETGALVGLFWGVVTGFYELYKVTVRMNRKPNQPASKDDPTEVSDPGDFDAGGHDDDAP
jgi:hypothetical protein